MEESMTGIQYPILWKANYSVPQYDMLNNVMSLTLDKMGLDARKPVFGGLRTSKAQTSLRIRAVWSALCYSLSWKFHI